MNENNDIVIQIRNLSKFIQSKAIVIRMSLDVPRGSLFGILGPNGAGKSTTLKLITGQIKATSGTISILGLDPWKDRVKLFNMIGYLPQNPIQPPQSTVLRFLTYMARLKGMSRRTAIYEAREVLSKVGLEKFEQNIIGKLSGGELQRLGFANCILGDPKILILDEPTASLDPEGRVYVIDLISKLAKDNNQTVIVSSHILPEIQRMSNHVAIMNEGKVLVSGNIKDLTQNIFDNVYEIESSNPADLLNNLLTNGYQAYLDKSTIIVETNGNLNELWVDVPKICVENNYQLKSFKPLRDSLENLFLEYVSRKYNNNGDENDELQ